jgi:hypothetical protein
MTDPQPRTPGVAALDDAEPREALRDGHRSRPERWDGWVRFGAVLVTVVGAFSVIEGLLALLTPTFFVTGGGRVLALNLAGWGWLHLVLGALVLVTGLGLLAGAPTWARSVALGLIAINMLVQLVWLPAFPIWSIIIVAFDLLVIYAIATTWPDWRTVD